MEHKAILFTAKTPLFRHRRALGRAGSPRGLGQGGLPATRPTESKGKNRPYALEANTLLFSVNLSPSTALDFIGLCGGGEGYF